MNKLVSGLIYVVVSVVISLIMIHLLDDYIFSSRTTIVTFIAMLSIYVVPLILGAIITACFEICFEKLFSKRYKDLYGEKDPLYNEEN